LQAADYSEQREFGAFKLVFVVGDEGSRFRVQGARFKGGFLMCFEEFWDLGRGRGGFRLSQWQGRLEPFCEQGAQRSKHRVD
jgi:hypothetical protein